MYKKALVWRSWAGIILTLAVLLLLMVFFTKLGAEILPGFVSRNICKASVETQDLLGIKNVQAEIDLKCPFEWIEIKEKNPERIKQEFAERYGDFCNEFGQGTKNLFGQRETTFCVLRKGIKFKHKDIKVEDFGRYLKDTKMPGQDLSYIEFCSGYKTERVEKIYKDLEFAQFKDRPIDTNKEYIMIFLYAKGEEEGREIMEWAFGTSPGHLGFYAGTGMVVVGYGITALTAGEGGIIGLPLAYLGKTIMTGGITSASLSGFLNWITNEGIKMEWASFFLIREFDEEVLKTLPCEYLPVEQG